MVDRSCGNGAFQLPLLRSVCVTSQNSSFDRFIILLLLITSCICSICACKGKSRSANSNYEIRFSCVYACSTNQVERLCHQLLGCCALDLTDFDSLLGCSGFVCSSIAASCIATSGCLLQHALIVASSCFFLVELKCIPINSLILFKLHAFNIKTDELAHRL